MLFGRGGMARRMVQMADLSVADVVVDVGCGPGSAVRRARRGGAARVVGIDPSERMLRLARRVTSLQRVTGSSFVEGAAEHLPVDTGSASVVWAIQSVHHWEDLGLGLHEVRRVLGPAGRVLLMERFVVPGARGLAAHGLTEQHAAELGAQLARVGFAEVSNRTVRVGRRTFVVITATAGSPPPAV